MPQQLPGYSLPPASGPEQQAELEAGQLLFQYGKPYSQQYQEWGERHPYQQFALERGTDLIPYTRIAKRIPGLTGIAGVLEAAEKVGKVGGWGGGAQIAEPRLKWGRVKHSKDNPRSYAIDVLDRKTGKSYGDVDFTLDRSGRQAHIDFWAMKDVPEDIGVGHLLHIKDELADKFPNIEAVQYERIPNLQKPGGGIREGQPIKKVTMPILRGRTGEPGAKLPPSQVKRKVEISSQEPASETEVNELAYLESLHQNIQQQRMFRKSLEEQAIAAKQGFGQGTVTKDDLSSLLNQWTEARRAEDALVRIGRQALGGE